MVGFAFILYRSRRQPRDRALATSNQCLDLAACCLNPDSRTCWLHPPSKYVPVVAPAASADATASHLALLPSEILGRQRNGAELSSSSLSGERTKPMQPVTVPQSVWHSSAPATSSWYG